MQFWIDEPSDFHKTIHIYVFWRADYEYNCENCRQVDFHDENIKNYNFMQLILLSYVSCYSFTLFSPCNPTIHWLSTLHFLTPLHDNYQAQISHHLGPKISTLWAPKNTLSVWFHLIRDDLNWKKLPTVYLPVWFHTISFFSKHNGFRANMCGTLKIDLFIRYNFCNT